MSEGLERQSVQNHANKNVNCPLGSHYYYGFKNFRGGKKPDLHPQKARMLPPSGRNSWPNCQMRSVTDSLLRLAGYSSAAASSCPGSISVLGNEGSPCSSAVHTLLWFMETSIPLTQPEIPRHWEEKGFQRHLNFPTLTSRSDYCWVLSPQDPSGKQWLTFQRNARDKRLWHITILCPGLCWFGTCWSMRFHISRSFFRFCILFVCLF